MAEKTTEETNDNPEVEETPVEPEEETPEEPEEKPIEEETPPEKIDEDEAGKLKAQRDKLYARLKKAEEKGKGKPTEFSNPMEAVKLGKALGDFSEDEIDEVIIRAKGKFDTLNPTPEQIIKASKDKNFTESITASRKKIADEKKVPDSSSPDFASGGKTREDIAKMSKEEFRKYAEEQEREGRTGI